VRHWLNVRDEHDTRKHYVELILKHGILRDVRGNPWSVTETMNYVGADGKDYSETKFHLLSSATLFEACYIAAETHPDNEQVKQTIGSPIKNITVFLARTTKARSSER
jgi:hypothetical protein